MITIFMRRLLELVSALGRVNMIDENNYKMLRLSDATMGISIKCLFLIRSFERKVCNKPSDWHRLLEVLKSEPLARPIAADLAKTYGKCIT